MECDMYPESWTHIIRIGLFKSNLLLNCEAAFFVEECPPTRQESFSKCPKVYRERPRYKVRLKRKYAFAGITVVFQADSRQQCPKTFLKGTDTIWKTILLQISR